MTTAEIVHEMMVGEDYHICYVGANDEYSERRVSVEDVVTKGGVTYVRCFCHKAQAARSFRADRIMHITSCALPAQPVFGKPFTTTPEAAALWFAALRSEGVVYATAG